MNDLLANIVAATHILYFLFVVSGVVAILVGPGKGWTWIRNVWFRILHFAAVYIVVFEDVFRSNIP